MVRRRTNPYVDPLVAAERVDTYINAVCTLQKAGEKDLNVRLFLQRVLAGQQFAELLVPMLAEAIIRLHDQRGSCDAPNQTGADRG